MISKLLVIVTGLMAQYPLGGVTWDYLQYILGLKRLGHDVYYIEDTGQWPYNPVYGGTADSCSYNVQYLANLMNRFGLADKWAYCFPWQSQWFGLPEIKRAEIIKSADIIINVSGSLQRPWDYRKVKILVYIDSDPVFTQVKLARGQQDFRKMIDVHDVHFSFGEAFSEVMPVTGHNWRPTRQPVVLSEWNPGMGRRNVFTTVMNWTSHNDVVYNGKTYGQKDVEFKRFLELPSKVAPTVLEIAVNKGKTRRTPYELLSYKGWRVVDPEKVCPDLDSYRTYIESSMAEWSVAKNGYVLGRPGWFSCRSSCYLAAGRPVVVQDTGFSTVLPVGEGILLYRTIDEAADAIYRVETNYAGHAKAAREIAEAYFDSDKVLTKVIMDAFSCNDRAIKEISL
jgi:hypothetical protein